MADNREVWTENDPAAFVRRTPKIKITRGYCTEHKLVQFVDGACVLCRLENVRLREPRCPLCHRRECSH
jgi:hypothetical protein